MRLKASNKVIAPWTHNSDHNPVDPINLVFYGTPLPDVVKTLGWGQPLPGFRSTQYIHLDDRMEAQTDQYSRTFTFVFQPYRFHIRFWDMGQEDGILAAAHRETIPIHVTQVFEQAEKTVARLFVGDPNWMVQYDSQPLENSLRQPPNNGYATVVTRQ